MRRRGFAPTNSKTERKRIMALRQLRRNQVIARDKGRDILTLELGTDVHEIIPRSHFGRKGADKCYSLKNMCVLTRASHQRIHALGKAGITLLLQRMVELYGYEYGDEPWAGFDIYRARSGEEQSY